MHSFYIHNGETYFLIGLDGMLDVRCVGYLIIYGVLMLSSGLCRIGIALMCTSTYVSSLTLSWTINHSLKIITHVNLLL